MTQHSKSHIKKPERIMVDSNIIIYAINSRSEKHTLAQQFLVSRQNQLCLGHQNILESIRVLTHPRFPSPMPTADAIEAVSRIAERLQVLAPLAGTQQVAKRIILESKLRSNEVFDAYLAATALCHDIKIIATDNQRDFGKIPEITTLNPFISQN